MSRCEHVKRIMSRHGDGGSILVLSYRHSGAAAEPYWMYKAGHEGATKLYLNATKAWAEEDKFTGVSNE